MTDATTVVPDADLPPSERQNPTVDEPDTFTPAPVDHALSGDIVSGVPAVIGPPSASEWGAMQQQVAVLANSKLVPVALRQNPDDIMVIILTGRELAIPPMAALNKIFVIEGKPSMSAELMAALVLRAGHEILVRDGDGSCTVSARRRGAPLDKTSTFAFSMDDARTANLLGRKPWKEHPRSMLRARAISAACRAVFPDVLMGVSYVPEELGAEIDALTGEVTVTVETIDEGTRSGFFDRIMALGEKAQENLRAEMKERDWVLRLLPVRAVEDFDRMLQSYEQWEPNKADDLLPQDDTQAVEGTVVDPPQGEPEPNGTDDTVADAEVVEDPPVENVDTTEPEKPAAKARGVAARMAKGDTADQPTLDDAK